MRRRIRSPSSLSGSVSDAPLLVFDVGGTWCRSAVARDDAIEEQMRAPSPSRARFPDASVEELQDMLVRQLAEEARRLREHTGATLAGVSLGAAVDGLTGLVVGSGPLWGPTDRLRFDIGSALRAAMPECDWVIVNDVTAAAMGLAHVGRDEGHRRMAVVTVSSGLAMRTIELATGRVAVSRMSGLQGEIGHLPAYCYLGQRRLSLSCDCGAVGHLGAYASGRGIAAVLQLAVETGADWLGDGAPLVECFTAQVAARAPEALEVLDAVTEPLARTLLAAFAVDADIGLVLITGGVVEALGRPYLDSLLHHVASLGLYGSPLSTAQDFEAVVRLAPSAPSPTLRGAVLAARDGVGMTSRYRRDWTIRATREWCYDVRLRCGLLDPANPTLRTAARLDRQTAVPRVVVADRGAWTYHGEAFMAYMDAAGATPRLVLLEPSEETKTIEQALEVADACDAAGLLRRSTPLIGFGGGAVLDVAGLAAALYRRGVPHVRVPTTLVGMIDAGIGVKTAVNHRGKKSLLGSYYPPDVVLVDPTFLRTLDEREIVNGLSEAVKIALICSPDLFELIVRNAGALRAMGAPNQEQMALLAGSITAMLDELRENLWEVELERRADFGHSFSPVIEMASLPLRAHGEAVALDMALSIVISKMRGLLDAGAAQRALSALVELSLPLYDDVMTPDLLWAALDDTRRHRDGMQRVPLLSGIGRATFVNDITKAELTTAIAVLRRRASVT
jgi:3-dehydroquinate synthetase/predicted NBD/HSP70 family sugar kinase